MLVPETMRECLCSEVGGGVGEEREGVVRGRAGVEGPRMGRKRMGAPSPLVSLGCSNALFEGLGGKRRFDGERALARERRRRSRARKSVS